MLVLSRKIGERIQIGDDVSIVVVGIDYNKVRIGIEAPADLPVNRQEVLESLSAEGRKHIKEGEEHGSTG